MKKVLLDSSVLFTAVNSPTGGSSKLFTLEKINLYVTPLILTEVERNVRKKLTSHHLERFFLLAKHLKILKVMSTQKEILKAEKVIVKKDAPILSDAKNSDVQILLTLDQKDFLKPPVENYFKPKKIMTPKMFFHHFKNRL